ncbi:MAG: amidohydrolase family protein [Oscillospiraceae bacterium]|nr:amidohydrolase family protein [Oscillospiraceae bacterium]
MLAIINAELVMKDHLIPEAVLFAEDGVITGYGEMRSTPIPEGCQVLDAQGAYVGPGLIDIHTHSGDSVYFFEDPVRVARHHLRHGTTTVMAVLYFNRGKEDWLRDIDTVKAVMGTDKAPNIGGFYMEGPYLNPKFGADRANNPWTAPLNPADYTPIVEKAGDAVRVWALAPEREGILDFVKLAKKVNPNVRFTVAHSEASPAQIEALMPYGLCIGTHHTNATGDLPKYPECRGVCVDETVNYNRDIYAEIISDSRGIHVDPYMQRLVRKIKGDDRIILISDTCEFDGPVPPGYDGVTDINFDHAGEIAGSKLTLEVACRNFMKHTGASIVDAFKYGSLNPATCLGLTDRGQIAVGKRADLILTDHKMNVKKVLLGGVVQE